MTKTAPPPIPHCRVCAESGIRSLAVWVAAQSSDGGKTVEFVLICDGHADGWNEGGDWRAPMYAIKTDTPLFDRWDSVPA